MSLCGEDASGRVVVQRTLRREAVLGWLAHRPPCLVGMEVCAIAHWFARELGALGHTARIIAPEFVPIRATSTKPWPSATVRLRGMPPPIRARMLA